GEKTTLEQPREASVVIASKSPRLLANKLGLKNDTRLETRALESVNLLDFFRRQGLSRQRNHQQRGEREQQDSPPTCFDKVQEHNTSHDLCLGRTLSPLLGYQLFRPEQSKSAMKFWRNRKDGQNAPVPERSKEGDRW